jgi:hypothetical protein
MRLAELRQDEHPNDAIPIYQEEVERAISAKDNRETRRYACHDARRPSSRSQAPSPPMPAVLPLSYHPGMVVRKKRSISMPPELDSRIELAAAAEGTSYSGWLAAVAGKEFTIRAGLDAVAGFERSHGRFTLDELAEAETWANEALARSKPSGTRRRQSA